MDGGHDGSQPSTSSSEIMANDPGEGTSTSLPLSHASRRTELEVLELELGKARREQALEGRKLRKRRKKLKMAYTQGQSSAALKEAEAGLAKAVECWNDAKVHTQDICDELLKQRSITQTERSAGSVHPDLAGQTLAQFEKLGIRVPPEEAKLPWYRRPAFWKLRKYADSSSDNEDPVSPSGTPQESTMLMNRCPADDTEASPAPDGLTTASMVVSGTSQRDTHAAESGLASIHMGPPLSSSPDAPWLAYLPIALLGSVSPPLSDPVANMLVDLLQADSPTVDPPYGEGDAQSDGSPAMELQGSPAPVASALPEPPPIPEHLADILESLLQRSSNSENSLADATVGHAGDIAAESPEPMWPPYSDTQVDAQGEQEFTSTVESTSFVAPPHVDPSADVSMAFVRRRRTHTLQEPQGAMTVHRAQASIFHDAGPAEGIGRATVGTGRNDEDTHY
ncbi:hypothetical protein BESB_045790 [Besnoitia besnoiti]|uniref:Uncharacterized protein n=1 Tax=Besnoitia besnoiti TaxID=94643 RepID=A0A2A9ML79_BESBE|nr:hypothetical protein BESB_045790 [Besnoitia besnoiti]PFH36387.1 hypothetical protein BESB_045790 [Besnoitia besnoiti]